MQPYRLPRPSSSQYDHCLLSMHITQLNRECLLHLFSFLDKDSRLSLSLTCLHLRDVFLEPGLWPLLRFHSPGELNKCNFLLGTSLRYLSICWYSSRVKVCNIEDWMKTTFQKDICSRHEGLVSAFLARVCKTCPNLISLTLAGCGHIADDDVVGVLRRCAALRCLHLENCVRITDTLLHGIVTYGSSLRTVQIDFCRNVTQAGLQVVASQRPAIQLSADRSAGMIPDCPPQDSPRDRRPRLSQLRDAPRTVRGTLRGTGSGTV